MSDRKWRFGDKVQFTTAPAKPFARAASRIGLVVVLVFTALLVARIVVVQHRRGVENALDRRTEREEKIRDWVKHKLGNPEATVVSFGDLREELFKSERWSEAMVSELSNPAESQFTICRFTFDREGEILDVSKRPVK